MSACGASPVAPTSPSGAASVVVASAVAQGPVSVPAAIVPVPPGALGATKFLAFGDSITFGTVLVATMLRTYPSVDPWSGRVRENAWTRIADNLYAAFGSDLALMGGDGLHPTPAGYQRMAQVFHRDLLNVFRVGGSYQ